MIKPTQLFYIIQLDRPVSTLIIISVQRFTQSLPFMEDAVEISIEIIIFFIYLATVSLVNQKSLNVMVPAKDHSNPQKKSPAVG